ncbi:hypothetical protein [Umezawaea beigongshangensis]|uniref:hypothetical protein n=1 Tax=Umezawaea beigongshangensis TaxID=2780383 RepID=UPI0018F17290|nr:hypothetical protein [Umezawaea beigongshangensis]
MSQLDLSTRPRPLVAAARGLGGAITALGSIVAALVGWGVVTAAQGDAITGLLGVLPAVVTAVTAVLVATGIVRQAEPRVTPLVDPRDDTGVPLVPIPGGGVQL